MKNKLSIIKDCVSTILENEPRARENDMLLYRLYIKKYLGISLPELETMKANYDTISRIRRKLQAEGKFRPLDENVIIDRAVAEKEYREEFKDKKKKYASNF